MDMDLLTNVTALIENYFDVPVVLQFIKTLLWVYMVHMVYGCPL